MGKRKERVEVRKPQGRPAAKRKRTSSQTAGGNLTGWWKRSGPSVGRPPSQSGQGPAPLANPYARSNLPPKPVNFPSGRPPVPPPKPAARPPVPPPKPSKGPRIPPKPSASSSGPAPPIPINRPPRLSSSSRGPSMMQLADVPARPQRRRRPAPGIRLPRVKRDKIRKGTGRDDPLVGVEFAQNLSDLPCEAAAARMRATNKARRKSGMPFLQPDYVTQRKCIGSNKGYTLRYLRSERGGRRTGANMARWPRNRNPAIY